MTLTGAFSRWRSMSLGTVSGLFSPFCRLWANKGWGKKITMQAWSMKKRMDEKHTITLSWSNTRITWYNFITSCYSTQWSCSMKHSPPFPTCLSCFVWASAFLPGHTALPLKGVWIATNWNKQQAHVLKQFSALCELRKTWLYYWQYLPLQTSQRANEQCGAILCIMLAASKLTTSWTPISACQIKHTHWVSTVHLSA